MRWSTPLVLLVLAGALLACGDQRCALQPKAGLCSANIDSYFFDPATRQCAVATFGGCDDGVRPFATLAECMASCE